MPQTEHITLFEIGERRGEAMAAAVEVSSMFVFMFIVCFQRSGRHVSLFLFRRLLWRKRKERRRERKQVRHTPTGGPLYFLELCPPQLHDAEKGGGSERGSEGGACVFCVRVCACSVCGHERARATPDDIGLITLLRGG